LENVRTGSQGTVHAAGPGFWQQLRRHTGIGESTGQLRILGDHDQPGGDIGQCGDGVQGHPAGQPLPHGSRQVQPRFGNAGRLDGHNRAEISGVDSSSIWSAGTCHISDIAKAGTTQPERVVVTFLGDAASSLLLPLALDTNGWFICNAAAGAVIAPYAIRSLAGDCLT
jgi:hypothetical protein